MTSEELLELLDRCRSVFRLETLQHYAVVDEADAERRRAFRGGKRLPPSPSKVEEIQLMRDQGKRVHRVHVVDLPLTPYLEYELAAYSENIAAGEDVRLADRAAHPALTELRTDFLLFDAETAQPVVVWFRYSSDGRLLGWERSDEPADTDRCRHERDLALERSRPVEEFQALVGTN